MSAFHFPQPGKRQNTAAVPVPEAVLQALVLSVVNGTANNRCEGCAICLTYQAAATHAFWLLSPLIQTGIVDVAEALGVNVYEWAGMPQ